MAELDGEIIIKLAVQALKKYVKHGQKIEITSEIENKLDVKRGVFVSLKKDGDLRGCIGTIEAVEKNLAHEIAANTIKACSQDPRFPEVKEKELPQIELSVDVLSPKEKVVDLDKLNPKKYGVIVNKGRRTGLLLPDLDGVDTVEKQLDIARRKAGLSPDEKFDIYRFQVKRFTMDDYYE